MAYCSTQKHTDAKFEDLAGKTLRQVEVVKAGKGDDQVRFVPMEGPAFVMHHCQDCCEYVDIEDICGDVDDLVGTPILLAEAVSNEQGEPRPRSVVSEYDSYTWTFYKFSTIKGSVTIRWLGVSNGYYSEGVDFCREPQPEQLEGAAP